MAEPKLVKTDPEYFEAEGLVIYHNPPVKHFDDGSMSFGLRVAALTVNDILINPENVASSIANVLNANMPKEAPMTQTREKARQEAVSRATYFFTKR